MLVKLNAKVIFEVEKPLLSLMKQIGVECVIKGSKLPFFDYHCPLLSLPFAFKTSLETIPPIFPLKINQKKIDYWKEKFKILLNLTMDNDNQKMAIYYLLLHIQHQFVSSKIKVVFPLQI
jgi:hypothetical protein